MNGQSRLSPAILALSSTIPIVAYGVRGTTISHKAHTAKLIRRYRNLKAKPASQNAKLIRSNAQEKEERLLEDKLPQYLPIRVKIRAEKEIAFRDLENDHWIRDFELEVKNTGTKPIHYMVLILEMPELKFGLGHMIFDLRFGDKKFLNFASGATPEDLSLMPGQTCILKLRPELDWKEYSRDMPHWPKPKQFVLNFQEISFGNGTGFRSSYDGPWPPPEKKPRLGACLQEPSLSVSVAKTDTDYGRSSKFSSGGKPANFLPAKFSYSTNLLFLGSLASGFSPGDSCCTGASCYWIREYDSDTACYSTGTECDSIHQAEYLLL